MLGTFNIPVVLLSFGISFLGAYTSICSCEQLRGVHLKNASQMGIYHVLHWLFLIGASLGGVGIWCMHFIGMSAMTLKDSNGNNVNIEFNAGVSLMSLVVAVFFICAGVFIASHDRVFAKTKTEILELFMQDFGNLTLNEIKLISAFRLLFISVTRELGYLVAGGLVAGSGVCIMHYVGMAAMEFYGRIHWNYGIIAASVIFAVLVSTIAFWILFRLLSMYPDYESLRILSALVMAIAVCGMHYGGMMAANFELDSTYKTHLAWKSTTFKNEEALYPCLLAAILVLWIFNVIISGDLRFKVGRYRHYLLKTSNGMEKFTALLSAIESLGGESNPNTRLSKMSRTFGSNSVAPIPNSIHPSQQSEDMRAAEEV